MTEDLIIIGAGGSSRQIADAVEAINQRERRWNLLGFLDDAPALKGQQIGRTRFLGPLSTAGDYSARFIVGVATVRNPPVRRRIVERLGLEPERFATLIHPSASISSLAKIGRGCAILQNVVITHDTVVGDHVLILHNVSIGHDVEISNYATVAPAAVLAGFSRLRSGCYVGAGAAINNGCAVNEGAIVGLGSVVVKDVPAGMTVVGNPAAPLRRAAARDRELAE